VNGHWICDLGRYGYEYLHGGRCLEVSGPAADRFGLNDAPAVASWLAAQLNALRFKGRQDRAVAVVSDWLTNEELFLAKAVFERDAGMRRIHLLGPRDGSPDGMLLTAERSPNRAGAGALGFARRDVRLEDLAREAEILIVFGHYLGEEFAPAELGASLAGVKTKVLCAPATGRLSGLFDVVVPTAWPAEKEGTFTNCQGLDQSFRPALVPPPAAWEEWRLLAEMGRALGRAPSFYLPLRGPADIRRAAA
jgi:NADH dehydrogenase/NADH:ubiquinone oxidoreductase subunit G